MKFTARRAKSHLVTSVHACKRPRGHAALCPPYMPQPVMLSVAKHLIPQNLGSARVQADEILRRDEAAPQNDSSMRGAHRERATP